MSDLLVTPLEEELLCLSLDSYLSFTNTHTSTATNLFHSETKDQSVLDLLNALFQQQLDILSTQDPSSPTQIHSSVVQQDPEGILREFHLCYQTTDLLAYLPHLPNGQIRSFLTHSYLRVNTSASPSRFQFIYHFQSAMSGVFFFRESVSQESVTFNNDILATRPNGTSASFCRGVEKIRPVGNPNAQHPSWRFYMIDELADLFQHHSEFNHVFGFYPIQPAYPCYLQTTILNRQHDTECAINPFAGVDFLLPRSGKN